MHSFKENSHLPFPSSHCKSPYSRQSFRTMDPTVNKIVCKARTSENNYGRSLAPVKPLTSRSSLTNSNAQFLPNQQEPSTSHGSQNSPDCITDRYEPTPCYSQHKATWSEHDSARFRPRKSQLGSTGPGPSPESKAPHVGFSSQAPDNPKATKLSEASRETHSRSFQMKPRQNQLRLFTGSVDNLMHWSKLKNSLHILFEVTATMVSFQPGGRDTEKCFWVSDSQSGPKLQVTFYEIDRPLPRLGTGSLVTCIGRLLTRNRLQAYKVEQSSEEQKRDLERLSFICNRVADEIASAIQRK